MSNALIANRYQLLETLGSGGMAEVWAAHDTTLERRVAIKILHRHLATDDAILGRFRSEARSAARLTHPGIVSIFDTVSVDRSEAIVMELVEGQDLRSVLDQRKVLAVDDAVEVAHQVALALAHAHQHGIIHRDVKPANILVSPNRRVKLSDFGIAKALGNSSLTETGSLVGTVKYLAPEQITAQPVDGRTDLYSLATVLFEMLCGEAPFATSDLAAAMDRTSQPARSVRSVRPEIPEPLDRFLRSALQTDPAARPPDAVTWAASLDAIRRNDRIQTDVGPAPTAMTHLDDDRTPVSADNTRIAPPDGQPISIPVVPTPKVSIPKPTLGLPEGDRSKKSKKKQQRRVARTIGRIAVAFLFLAALVTIFLLLQPSDSDEPAAAATSSTVSAAPPAGDTTPADPDLRETADSAGFVNGVRVSSIDPLGDDNEHPEAVDRAVDDDPDSFWYTQTYNTRLFGGIKSGVGYVIEFEEPRALERLQLDTNNTGWAASVYAADQKSTTLDGWGEPVASFTDLSSNPTLETTDLETSAVLIWITDLGEPAALTLEPTIDEPDGEEEPETEGVRLEIFDVRVFS